jgi:hypothetical protein
LAAVEGGADAMTIVVTHGNPASHAGSISGWL